MQRRQAGRPVLLSELQLYLVDKAPAPIFAWLKRAHDGVLGVVKVLGGVPVHRRIAAAHVPADEAEP